MARKLRSVRMSKGMFITIEGSEGSGKSTQTYLLSESLKKAGWSVVTAREPGGTSVGEAVRSLLKDSKVPMHPMTEIFLFEASRSELVSAVIMPALNKGSIVVCDRFVDSTVAYQGYARGFNIDQIITLNSMASFSLMPDLTILLDIDVNTGFDRIEQRNMKHNACLDRIELEDRVFHEQVRSGFRDLADKWPDRISIVDASLGQDEIAEKILDIVMKRIECLDL